MPLYMVSPEVRFLLMGRTGEKVYVYNGANPSPFRLPKIGPRPPYYANPRYVPRYPLI
ncbi:hypothetical protein [Cohnella caldifontis]|uniref:hypothetical protein n=1 Tax=Cohnella caldifontis TaxID=3027471 RepID=UPI0023ED6D3F|nr:hypothetical protein [Cohnella sp. YIM B05605]